MEEMRKNYYKDLNNKESLKYFQEKKMNMMMSKDKYGSMVPSELTGDFAMLDNVVSYFNAQDCDDIEMRNIFNTKINDIKIAF